MSASHWEEWEEGRKLFLRPLWPLWRSSGHQGWNVSMFRGCRMVFPPFSFIEISSQVLSWKGKAFLYRWSPARQGLRAAPFLRLFIHPQRPRVRCGHEHKATQLNSDKADWSLSPRLVIFKAKKCRCMASCNWNDLPSEDDAGTYVVVLWHSQYSAEKVSNHKLTRLWPCGPGVPISLPKPRFTDLTQKTGVRHWGW